MKLKFLLLFFLLSKINSFCMDLGSWNNLQRFEKISVNNPLGLRCALTKPNGKVLLLNKNRNLVYFDIDNIVYYSDSGACFIDYPHDTEKEAKQREDEVKNDYKNRLNEYEDRRNRLMRIFQELEMKHQEKNQAQVGNQSLLSVKNQNEIVVKALNLAESVINSSNYKMPASARVKNMMPMDFTLKMDSKIGITVVRAIKNIDNFLYAYGDQIIKTSKGDYLFFNKNMELISAKDCDFNKLILTGLIDNNGNIFQNIIIANEGKTVRLNYLPEEYELLKKQLYQKIKFYSNK